MKIIKVVSILVALNMCDSVFGQELIRNGGFQLGTKTGGCLTHTDDGGFDELGMTFWSFATDRPGCSSSNWLSSNICPSPDWLDFTCFDGNGSANLGTLTIKKPTSVIAGDRFMGLASDFSSSKDFSEGVRIELNSNLEPGHYYTLKMKMCANSNNATNGSNNVKLKVSFAKWGEHWASTGSGHVLWDDITDAFSIPFNASDWVDVEYNFRAPDEVNGGGSDELKNLILMAHHSNTVNHYMFIDDVSLVHIDPCNSICAPDSAFATLRAPAPPSSSFSNTNMNPNDGTRSTWKATVQNATYIKVEIWAQNGQKLYEQTQYDPNVLIDAGTERFGIEWGGTGADGEPLLGAGANNVYLFKLTTSNCSPGGKQFDDFTVTFQHLSEELAVHIPDFKNIQNAGLPKCCPEFLDLDNFDYTNSTLEAREKYIRSGINGNVTVKNGTDVEYYAKDEITLGDFFSVESGAEFSAELRTCESAPRFLSKFNNVPTDYVINEVEAGDLESFYNQIHINYRLHPNPSKNIITVLSSNLFLGEGQSFKIISNVGEVVQIGWIGQTEAFIDISLLPTGIYYFKIKNDIKKIIKN